MQNCMALLFCTNFTIFIDSIKVLQKELCYNWLNKTKGNGMKRNKNRGDDDENYCNREEIKSAK